MKAPHNEREAYFALSKPVKHKPMAEVAGKTNKLLLVFVIILLLHGVLYGTLDG